MAGAGSTLGKPKKAPGKSAPPASSEKAAASQAKAGRSPGEGATSRTKAEVGPPRGKAGQPPAVPPLAKAEMPSKVEGADKTEEKAKQPKAAEKKPPELVAAAKPPEAGKTPAEGVPLKTINSKTQLDKFIKEAGERLVVIFFSGTWCEACQGLKPAMREIAELNNLVFFYEVNVDDSEDTAEACDIVHIPTFQFYKLGKKVAEVLDDDRESIEEKIKELK